MTAEDPKAFADFVLGAISEEEWRGMSEPTPSLAEWVTERMAEAVPIAELRESTFPKTWAGFRAFLDEQYPEDVFPDDDRDLGPAFVVAARRLAAAEVRLEAVRALHFPYDCTEAGAEGHETCGEREWCYSCGEEQPWPCTTYQALRN